MGVEATTPFRGDVQGKRVGLSPLTLRALDTAGLGGVLLQYAGAAPVPGRPVVARGLGGNGWLVVDAADDPHVIGGTFAMPARNKRHLRQIDATGVKFDRLFIAHELAVPYDKLDVAALGAPGTIEKLVGKPTPSHTATRLIRATKVVQDALATAAMVTLEASAMALLAPLALLDPAVLGVVTASPNPAPGDLGAWFVLTHWT